MKTLVLYFEDNKPVFRVDEIDEISLEYMYEVCNCSTIEHFPYATKLAYENIHMWLDEEGKYRNQRPSMVVFNRDKSKIIDIIAGPVLFTSVNGEETIGLTDEQINTIQSSLYISIIKNKYTQEIYPVRTIQSDEA